MKLQDMHALITGASKGIGKATAIAIAKQGASVIIHYNTDEEGAMTTLYECNKYSQHNSILHANLTKEDEVESLFTKINQDYEHMDILVNNAGIFDEADDYKNIHAFEHLFQHNFLTYIRVVNKTLEQMKKGKIVNVSSIHGQLGMGNNEVIAYASMKAAINSYTKNLAKKLAPDILVNAVAPGYTMTPMWGEMSDKEEQEYASHQLINRFITPEEVADSILFLLQNDAMVGEILTIDGGLSLKEVR